MNNNYKNYLWLTGSGDIRLNQGGTNCLPRGPIVIAEGTGAIRKTRATAPTKVPERFIV